MKTKDKLESATGQSRVSRETIILTIVVSLIVVASVVITAWSINIGLDGRPGSPATQASDEERARQAAEQRLEQASQSRP